MTTPLQASWFVDFALPWLSAGLIFLGFFTSFAFLFLNYRIEKNGGEEIINSRQDKLGVIALSAGVTFMLVDLYSSFPKIQIIGTYIIISFVEGFSSLLFIQKVESVISTRSIQPAMTGGLKRRLIAKFMVVLIMIISFWVVIVLIITGNINFEFSYILRVLWTVLTVAGSFFGLAAKYWRASEDIPLPMFLGVLGMISGAEIYNFSFIPTNIIVFAITNLVFFTGYIYGIKQFISEV